ncbi:MAG: hypothetical protein LAQ69_01700 [Acidobacteriia bacterium]|nr:hypothetical protein [Terriglobia bacterium]
MYRLIVSLTLPAFFAAWGNPGATASNSGSEQAEQKPKQDQKQKPSKAKDSAASLTGCIDEHDGHYVMISDRTRDPIADLEAEGFETEGFAKHVGHKVTVRGTSNPGDARPLFRVRSIETISDTCAQALK